MSIRPFSSRLSPPALALPSTPSQAAVPAWQRLGQRCLSYAVIFSIGVIGLLLRQTFAPNVSPEWNAATLAVVLAFMISLWEGCLWIERFLDVRLPYQHHLAGRITLQMLMSWTLVLALRYIVLLYARYILQLEFALEFKLLIASFVIDLVIVVAFNGWLFGKHFFREWKNSMLTVERLAKESVQVRFENLKNQLNPHFLFNSLASLNSLIFENQELASEFLQHLSKVYRYLLQNKEAELVLLESELGFIQNYLFLLKTRFGRALEIRMETPPFHQQKRIVPVTLQVLLENALKHNCLSADNPLRVEIYVEERSPNAFDLIVINTFQPKSIVETSNKTGLQNMQRLYSFLSATPLRVEKTETHFTVRVPLIS